MEIDEKYLFRVLKILARALAHERVESYALRTLLIDPNNVDASVDIQNKARELAKTRYHKLLCLVDDNSTEDLDLMRFLKDFDALMRRE
jgi:hypothetical protein